MDEKAAEMLGPDSLKALASANWKERLAAMEKFKEVSNSLKFKFLVSQVCNSIFFFIQFMLLA